MHEVLENLVYCYRMIDEMVEKIKKRENQVFEGEK